MPPKLIYGAPIIYDPSSPWRIHLAARDLVRIVSYGLDPMRKGLVVPPGGWSAQSFRVHGDLLRQTMHKVGKIVQRKAWPYVHRAAKKIMLEQLRAVVDKVTGRVSIRAVHEINVSIGASEDIWIRAINEVFREQGIDAIAELTPPIQSVMAQGYSKTNVMLGQHDGLAATQKISARSREIASRITRINETTRKQFVDVVTGSTREGLTIKETADRLEASIDDMTRARLNTIARTETSNAWTEGAVTSFMESDVLATVDVIGCEAREPNSPQYHGESTCNITGVPVHDADILEFHPNHTGVMVPGSFREDTATPVDLGG